MPAGSASDRNRSTLLVPSFTDFNVMSDDDLEDARHRLRAAYASAGSVRGAAQKLGVSESRFRAECRRLKIDLVKEAAQARKRPTGGQ